MFERFTEQSSGVISLAQDEARNLKHNYIGSEHLLLGLTRAEGSLAQETLTALGVRTEKIRAFVVAHIGEGTESLAGQIPFTPRTKKILGLTLREARSLGHNYIGTEHILLGLARENEGVAAIALTDVGVTADAIRNEVVRRLSGRIAQAKETAPTAYARGWADGYKAALSEMNA